MKLKRYSNFLNENSEWLEYAKSTDIDENIIRFVEKHPEYLEEYSPRVWGNVSDLIKRSGSNEETNEIISILTSPDVAHEYIKMFNLNESVLQKDLDRMESIVKKSKGDKESMMKYVHSMAKAIKDKHKAFQRGKASDTVLKDKEAGDVFFKRAQELGLDFDINVERSKTGLSKFGINKPTLGSEQSPRYPEPQKRQYEPYSIFPVGSINIQTGECKYFNVYEDWADSTAEVWKDEKGNYKLVVTSGDKPFHNIGWIGNFRHDQTWREIGYRWTMVEWVNIKDLKDLLSKFNKKSMYGYTYK